MKAVTNGPKQVVECGNSMKNLSIYCIAKKKTKKNPKNSQTNIRKQACVYRVGEKYNFSRAENVNVVFMLPRAFG